MKLQKKGRLGEDLAVKYLVGKGFEIVERNLRVGRLELDVVAAKSGKIYFFEVKSSFLDSGESPLMRIDQKKLNHVYRAALAYMAERGKQEAFEVMGISVCVNLASQKAQIEVVSCGWN